MSRILRLHVELLLFAVIAFNVWQAVVAPDVFIRAITTSVVVSLAALVGFRYGHHRATMAFVESMADAVRMTPTDVTWHVDDNGVRHALVTTHGGEVRSIEIPDTVDNPEQALAYIIDALHEEDESEQ